MQVTNRPLGMTIIGQTGFGKSAFLHNLIMEDIQEGRSSIVIDPHGDLSTDILESIDRDHAKNVSTLEVSEEMPFGLNLYQCDTPQSPLAVSRTVDNSILVFKRLMQDERGFHPHIEFLLRNLAYLLVLNPEYSLAESGLLFEQSEAGKALRSQLLQKMVSRDAHSFWHGVEERKGNLAYQYVEPLLNKVSPFVIAEPFRLIVGQNKTTIPFSDFLDQPGKTLIVSLPIGILGEEMTQALGMMFLSLLSENIYERVRQRKESRVPIHLYIDEAGLFFSSGTAISKLLKQGRKFGCATHLSFQTLSDLPDKEAQSAVLQTGTLVFFQVIGGTDAEILSKQLKVKQPPVDPVPKMRMEPNIKEWDEEIWTDEQAKWIYEHPNQYIWEQTKEQRKKIYALEGCESFARISCAWTVTRTEDDKQDALKLMEYDYQSLVAEDQKVWNQLDQNLAKYDPDTVDKKQTMMLINKFITTFRSFSPAQIPELMRNYLQTLQKEIATRKSDVDREGTKILAGVQGLRDKYHHVVHHQEQNGWIAVKEQESRIRYSVQPNYSRRGPANIERTTTDIRDIQIYDMVEGTPRPFSDLWNEMQANLATLPPYHYYMQTISEQKEIIESQHKSTKPPQAQDYGVEQAAHVRQRSLLYFGTPAEQVRKELQDRIAPFLGRSEDDSPDIGKSGEKPKPKPKGPPISGAKPYP